jgi:hypothetical protein
MRRLTDQAKAIQRSRWDVKPVRLIVAYILKKMGPDRRYRFALWLVEFACMDVMQGEQQKQWALTIRAVSEAIQKHRQSGMKKVRVTVRLTPELRHERA